MARARSIVMPQSTPRSAPQPTEGFLVGGAVRDILLGRAPKDLDWLVPEPAAEAERAAATLRAGPDPHASAFLMDAERQHWRLVWEAGTVDYAPLEGPLADDLRRRDFTVNAIAAEPDGTIVDPLDGRRDLAGQRVRMTSAEALAADPIRVLRGVRLATELGFTLEPATQAAMEEVVARQAAGGALPAWERTGAELQHVLMAPAAAHGFRLAQQLGALALYLPELAACEGLEQGGFHHLDVLGHQLEALHALLGRFPDAEAAVRWATLMHDVGKPGTRAVQDDGRVHFYGHARLGQRLLRTALTRLRLPQPMIERASLLVRYHMLPLPRDERGARRFVHRRRALLPDLLRLMLADREAARGPLSSEASRTAYRVAMSRVLAVLDAVPARPPLMNGTEVMALLGILPGPHVGEALRLLAESEALGDVATYEEASALLLRYAQAQGWETGAYLSPADPSAARTPERSAGCSAGSPAVRAAAPPSSGTDSDGADDV